MTERELRDRGETPKKAILQVEPGIVDVACHNESPNIILVLFVCSALILRTSRVENEGVAVLFSKPIYQITVSSYRGHKGSSL